MNSPQRIVCTQSQFASANVGLDESNCNDAWKWQWIMLFVNARRHFIISCLNVLYAIFQYFNKLGIWRWLCGLRGSCCTQDHKYQSEYHAHWNNTNWCALALTQSVNNWKIIHFYSYENREEITLVMCGQYKNSINALYTLGGVCVCVCVSWEEKKEGDRALRMRQIATRIHSCSVHLSNGICGFNWCQLMWTLCGVIDL